MTFEWREQDGRINAYTDASLFRPYEIKRRWFFDGYVVKTFLSSWSGGRPRKARFQTIDECKRWAERDYAARQRERDEWRNRGTEA